MPHRDALEAAMAKIEALEGALAEARAARATDDAMRDSIALLEQRLAAAERERAELRAELAQSQRSAHVLVPAPSDTRAMTTLDEHNLAIPPAGASAEWPRARVLCPSCAERGERVEMVVRGGSDRHEGVFVKILSVTCLRCGATGTKRVS